MIIAVVGNAHAPPRFDGMPYEKDKIVAVGLITREDVRSIGTSLRLVYRAEDLLGFDDLLDALDATGLPQDESAEPAEAS